MLYFDKEAWFTLNGYISDIYWSTENSHAVHGVSLNDLKFGVWCVIAV
jgi:hypothetical protein